MEAKTFSRDSFVYRFLAWPTGNLWFSVPYDICQLRRDVILKIFLLLTIVSATFGYAYSVTSYVLYEMSQLFGGVFGTRGLTEIVKFGGALTYITLLFAALAGIFWALDKAQKYFSRRK
jgi:hypothetical protein